MTSRRAFLKAAAAGCAIPGMRAQAPDSRVEVLLNEPVGTIAPEIYSHFVENLGGVVYDGIWVGESSKIANVGGVRKQLVEALARVKPGVIRWPGGCFADQYDWHDGVGPRDKRPKRTNFWLDAGEWPKDAKHNGPEFFDPNQFGTIEFARFCRLAGGQPYFAANLRSLPAQDFWRWVEYCNSPAHSTTLSDLRAADGEAAPLNVKYWGVGNESWGCGGDFTPEDYATEFRRYSAWVPGYGQKLSLVGSGPNDNNLDWTRKFFAKAGPTLGHMWGWALHHYSWNVSSGRTTNWSAGKGDAVKFQPEQYYELLREAQATEGMIQNHWDAMGEFDRQRRVKLVVDEWGAWHAPGTEPYAEALIGQQNTMRDAVLAGLSLDIFNRHADKVGMANIAQLVNCLQSLFFAHEDNFCVTPTYHVFDMYAPHQSAQAVRAMFSSPAAGYTRNGKAASIAGLTGSASVRGKQLTITMTNARLDSPCDVEITLSGGYPGASKATILQETDVHAHNSFQSPNAVQPRGHTVTVSGPVVRLSLPPACVARVDIPLS